MLKLIRGLHNLNLPFSGCAVTIGNFDGLHLGHQMLIKHLQAQGKARHLPTVLITFEPQPNEYFADNHVPPRLSRLREKLLILQAMQVDYVLCLRFDKNLAHLSAEDFVKNILVARLKTQYLLVGDDFHFGYQRQGDLQLLKKLGEKYAFQVEAMSSFLSNSERVSSTRIRKALELGDLDTASRLLGHLYSLAGRVAHGDKRGRIIGFPTANVYLHRKAVPILGVYAVRTWGLGSQPVYGVANIGNRPTVNGTRSLLEVHLFDFDKDIYGKHILVEFLHKLRDEQRFESFELLKQQIFKDAEAAKNYIQSLGKS